MYVNVFEKKSDEELFVLYGQFLEVEKVGFHQEDSELRKIKKYFYDKRFEPDAGLILQIELTHAIADRWFNQHNDKV